MKNCKEYHNSDLTTICKNVGCKEDWTNKQEMCLEIPKKQTEIGSPSFESSVISFEFEDTDSEDVEDIARVPTPPPLPPIERSPLGPDNIPGPPQEIPVKLDEDPIWDPIRAYLPSLLWLEQYKPGLINALFDMVNTLGHKNTHECTLKRVFGLKDRFALSSEIYDLPKQAEASSQTNLCLAVASFKTNFCRTGGSIQENVCLTEASFQTNSCLAETTETNLYPTPAAFQANPLSGAPLQAEVCLTESSTQTNVCLTESSTQTIERFPQNVEIDVQTEVYRSIKTNSGIKFRFNSINSIDTNSRAFKSRLCQSRDRGTVFKNTRLCWNCRKAGHPYSYCTEARRTFCQICGRRGYTAKTCPNCGETWRAMGPYHPKLGTNIPRAVNIFHNRYDNWIYS